MGRSARGESAFVISVDTYLQPDAPDPVLEPGFVLSLARRHAPKAAEVRAVDESGGEARSYLIDEGLVMKTQRPNRLRPRTSLSKETFILEALAAHANLPVPEVVGYGQEGPVEYILMTRMPGIAARHSAVNGEARIQMLRRLGAVLHHLHGIDQRIFDSTELIPGDRSATDLRERLNGIFGRLEEAVEQVEGWPADLAPTKVGETFLAALPVDVPLVVLHSNPGPEHTFVTADGGEFTGIIDFGDSYRSHPALDLRSWIEPADAEEILRGYAGEGEIAPGFDVVWRAGRSMMEIALAARRRETAGEASSAVRRLLGAEF